MQETTTAPGRRAPGPRGTLILGSLKERREQPLKLYMNAILNYGDVVQFKMGPMKVFLVNSHTGIKHVLQDNQKNYFKGRMYDSVVPLLGRGLLTSEGDFWRRQRKLAQPAFHRQRLEGFCATMAEATGAMLKRWKDNAEAGETLDIAREMMRLTMAIVSRTLLSTDVSQDADSVGASLSRLIEDANTRLLSILPPLFHELPTPKNLRYKKDKATLNEVVFRMIRERRDDPTDRGDLLSMLMQARDEETGESMNDEQLRDETMTIFLAGHETTANVLSWTLYLLSKHPEVARKLQAEVDSVLERGRAPGFTDVPRLRYTHMVLEEAMRLYPPAWILARETRENDVIDGYAIPKGSFIVLCPYVTHRNPRQWENPEGFDPERFLLEKIAERPKYAYFPFSGGPRQCIGNTFAMMEAQVVLAMIVSQFRLDLVPGHPVEPEALITLRPKHGVLMSLHPRFSPDSSRSLQS